MLYKFVQYSNIKISSSSIMNIILKFVLALFLLGNMRESRYHKIFLNSGAKSTSYCEDIFVKVIASRKKYVGFNDMIHSGKCLEG